MPRISPGRASRLDADNVDAGIVDGEIAHFQNAAPGCARRRRRAVCSACRDHRRVRAEHQPTTSARQSHPSSICRQPFGPDLADLAAEPQDRDAVAEGEGFLELVGDEDDGQARSRRRRISAPSSSTPCGVSIEVGSSRIRTGCRAAAPARSRPVAARRATGRRRPGVGIDRHAELAAIAAAACERRRSGRCHQGPPSIDSRRR